MGNIPSNFEGLLLAYLWCCCKGSLVYPGLSQRPSQVHSPRTNSFHYHTWGQVETTHNSVMGNATPPAVIFGVLLILKRVNNDGISLAMKDIITVNKQAHNTEPSSYLGPIWDIFSSNNIGDVDVISSSHFEHAGDSDNSCEEVHLLH